MRHLARPSLDALGSAYVEGLLDVEGDLEQGFEVAAQLARHAVKPVGRFGRIVRSVRHTRTLDAEAIAYSFNHAWTSIYQILAVKSDKPQIDRIPLTRDFMYRETS